jgi:Ribbon-helix-helix protein, copG family
VSKRLQVLIPDADMSGIRKLARREQIPVGEWVRRALREARAGQPVHDAERKLKAVRRAVQHAFPSGEIEQMLEEVERGYLS